MYRKDTEGGNVNRMYMSHGFPLKLGKLLSKQNISSL